MIDYRPWGKYEVLIDEKNCKVKKITVKPGGRLSYQYHYKRSEIWVIVQGEAVATLDEIETVYRKGEVVVVPVGTSHRIENRQEEDLKFIEIQTGTYFGEDDIVRLEDDYGREGTNE